MPYTFPIASRRDLCDRESFYFLQFYALKLGIKKANFLTLGMRPHRRRIKILTGIHKEERMHNRRTVPMDAVRKTKYEEITEEKEYIRRKKIISILSFAVFAIFLVVITLTVGKTMIAKLSDPEGFRTWVDNHGFWGQLSMIGMMALQVVVAVIPGEPMEIGAGYAFGGWKGLFLCLIGAAAGSCIVFLLTRAFGVKMVEAFISREKIQSLKFVQDSKRLNLLIFILFFIPGSPKDVLTYFVGLTNMKLTTFLLISTIARVPSVITSTLGGNAIGMKNYTFAIIVFCATAVISLVGVLVYRKISKKGSDNSHE